MRQTGDQCRLPRAPARRRERMLKMYNYLTAAIADLRDREDGQTLVEYALILFIVSIGALVALGTLSDSINGVFDDVTAAL
jgi:Flp pilus assembly pilin Flp